MEKEFVPYEQSLELKELGFDEPCMCFYNNRKELKVYHNADKDWNTLEHQLLSNSKITLPNTYSAPTYSQVFRWFREKYKLSGTPHYFTNGFYCYTINDMKNSKKSNRLFTEFETYEEAELACLRKLIEIIKNATKE
jgi:hypothetical protein